MVVVAVAAARPMPPSASAILRRVREITDHVAVGVSCGKDSTAALALCRSAFPHVSAFFGYMVPGLSFQERYLAYLERKFSVSIRRVPHCDLGRWIRSGVYRPITRASLKAPVLTSAEWFDWLRAELGAEWIVLGGKAADNVHRNGRLHRCGGVDERRREVYPVAFWKDRAVLAFLKMQGIALPPDYRFGAESLRLQSAQGLRAIRDQYPADWRKVLEVFPYAETRILRDDFARGGPDDHASPAGAVHDAGGPAVGAETGGVQPADD